MPWFEVLVPAVVTAILVRVDAIVIGPYFAMMSLVPGFHGLEAPDWYRDVRLRWAVIRRFSYAFILGGVLTIIDPGLTSVQAAIVGAITALLLLWPVVFASIPPAGGLLVAAVYGSLVLSFAGLAAAGRVAVIFAKVRGEGSIARFFIEEGVRGVLFAAIGMIGAAFFGGTYNRALKKRWSKPDDDGDSQR